MQSCRTIIHEQATQFGAITERFARSHVGNSPLGTLPTAAALASVVEDLYSTAGEQFSAAAQFLHGAARGLESTGRRIMHAELGNAEMFVLAPHGT